MKGGFAGVDMNVLGVPRSRDRSLLQLDLVPSWLARLKGVGKYTRVEEDKIAASEACERGSGHVQTCQRGLHTPCIFFLRFLSTQPSCTGAARFGEPSGPEDGLGSSVSGIASKTTCR